MEFYIFILGVLFFTAISDLYVGVANDAVNFLNSATGSKAASRRTILMVAAVGILFGTTFSSGMMEVAQKGIFNPDFFTMHEVMIIFLAVMLTDILLLDLYNTFGLPTSTTVSIVFEIFGGAVAIGLIKVLRANESVMTVMNYINTANVVTIIVSIGLSVVLAFVFGVIIQFISRVIFTFNYEKTFRRYGAIYCGAALAMITYFLLVKGAKGSSLLSPDDVKWLKTNLSLIIWGSFVAWTIFFQILVSFTKVNVLKIIVLIGTFALALAFAANDLVNFIGAPIGALSAFQIGSAAGSSDTMMEALKAPVRANIWILLAAGVVMVLTLIFSRKARTVTKTEVSLGRQEEGVERFESIVLARSIVRMSISLFSILKKLIPDIIQQKIKARIDPNTVKPVAAADGEVPSFDLLRAAVNLMVSSALISFGTSLKLPLSTTFVTFMVAMSTSLADQAWGRESAVYRVTGVITVIGGWFFTAFMAFTTCFLFSLFIFNVGLPAIIILVIFGFFFFFRSNRLHRDREAKFERQERELEQNREIHDPLSLISLETSQFLTEIPAVLDLCCNGLISNKRKVVKSAAIQASETAARSERLVEEILRFIKNTPEDERLLAPSYAQKIGSLQVIGTNLQTLTNAVFKHIDNNHRPPDEIQAAELAELNGLFQGLVQNAAEMIKNKDFSKLAETTENLEKFRMLVRRFDKNQMKRIKKKKSGSRISLLYVTVLSRIERIALQIFELIKIHHGILLPVTVPEEKPVQISR